MSEINGAPPLPRGQMPIEEVFKMMWSRMNYLENALKEKRNANENVFPKQNNENTTISDLKNENSVIDNNLVDSKVLTDMLERIENQESRINEISESLTQIKRSNVDQSSKVDRAIESIGADLTDMNTKYTQMNNFLVEIQTTQITVNNQILRNYNDSYNDMVESKIEQSASEKFLNKENESLESNELETTEENQESEKEESSVTSNIENKNNEPVVVSKENIEQPQKGNTITFNIE